MSHELMLGPLRPKYPAASSPMVNRTEPTVSTLVALGCIDFGGAGLWLGFSELNLGGFQE